MQTTTRLSTIARTVVVSGSLLAALAFGGVAASSTEVGLTECDHGCKVETLRGTGDGNGTAVLLGLDISAYISNGPGDIGFTR